MITDKQRWWGSVPVVKLCDVDFALLRQQKRWLVRFMLDKRYAARDRTAAEGLVNFFDCLQDNAAEVLGERAVFGIRG